MRRMKNSKRNNHLHVEEEPSSSAAPSSSRTKRTATTEDVKLSYLFEIAQGGGNAQESEKVRYECFE